MAMFPSPPWSSSRGFHDKSPGAAIVGFERRKVGGHQEIQSQEKDDEPC